MKAGDVESAKNETEDGKSAKTVPVEAMKGSSDVEMASKPLEVKDNKLIENPELGGEVEFGLKDEKFVNDPLRITMVTKKDFRDAHYPKSGKYFLLEKLLIRAEVRKCGLLVSLRIMTTFNPCAAMFQRCYSVVQMIRMMGSGIDDLKPLKIIYWDNSFLFVNEGKSVGVKIPTEVDIKWLDSLVEAEKTLVELTKCLDLQKDWDTITVPNPKQYPNYNLFFAGHLDSDAIKDIEIVSQQVTDKLTDSFMKLGCQSSVVVVDSDQQVDTHMDTDKSVIALKDANVGPSQLAHGGFTTTDDLEKGMTNEVLDSLHLNSRGAKDSLSTKDMLKYTGIEQFNPKSFKSGSSIGFIDLNAVSHEVLFAQIRILKELMFNVISLSRYNHLVRN